ncbi:hypothetical protein BV898_00465 [Hypsibius exemplaris]|uniref:Uncharacterized protein n=1 Tax=Hypsibius exemplaris TaxID=2072580 RepID=A0A1W0XDG8_HYPEX|nr:hypothetical protein BV898_00465 [Hypsibius exemplaris]
MAELDAVLVPVPPLGDAGGAFVEIEFPLPGRYPLAAPTDELGNRIYYSPIFKDATFEYRYLIFPEGDKVSLGRIPDNQLLSPTDFKGCGAIIEPGWQNCCNWRQSRQALTCLLRRGLHTARDDFLDPAELMVDPNAPLLVYTEAAPNAPAPMDRSGKVRATTVDMLQDRKVYNDGILRVFDALERIS